MQLLNTASGQPEELDSVSALSALAAGTHTPLNGAKLLVNPLGEPVVADPETVDDKLGKYDYKYPTQEQLDTFAAKKKYGEGTANELKAFGAGAARGATFGLSDVAARGFGVKPETLKGLEDYNPTASTVGELTGIGATGLLFPESLVGKTSRLGEMVGGALAPKALTEGATLAQRIVHASSDIGAKALGSAVEGSIYGLGQSISEEALGDPDLNAQKIAANIGFGALIGGALGGSFRGLGMAKDTISDTISGKMENFYQKAVGGGFAKEAQTVPEKIFQEAGIEVPKDIPDGVAEPADIPEPGAIAKTLSIMTGRPVEEVQKELQRGLNGELMTPVERKRFAKSASDAFQEHYDSMKKVGDAGMGEARSEETATLIQHGIANGEVDPTKVRSEFNRILGDAQKAWSESVADDTSYSAIGTKKIESIIERMENVGENATAVERFKILDGVKKDLFDLKDRYLQATRTIPEQESGRIFKDLHQDIRHGLEDGDIWGPAGARQSARNSAYSDFRDAEEAVRRQFMQKGKVKGRPTYKAKGTKFNTYFNQINDPTRGDEATKVLEDYFDASRRLLKEAETTQKTAQFEGVDLSPIRKKLTAAEGIAQRAKGIVQKAPGGLGGLTDMIHPLSAVKNMASSLTNPVELGAKLAKLERLATKTSNSVSRLSRAVFSEETGAKETKAFSKETIQKNIDKSVNLAGDANTMMQKVEEMTAESHAAAPKISQALQSMAIRGAMFLASKAPKIPPPLPFDPPSPPSNGDLQKFIKYYEAVHDPTSILDDLTHGFVHNEKIEALSVVYPNLFDHMRHAVFENLSLHRGRNLKLSYQRQTAISKFLGVPLSKSMTPQNFQLNQVRAEEPRKDSVAHPTQKGLGNITLSERLLTNSQATSQRER